MTITYTAHDFVMPARAELLAEIKAGKDIDALAAELAQEEAAEGLTVREIAEALRWLAKRG